MAEHVGSVILSIPKALEDATDTRKQRKMMAELLRDVAKRIEDREGEVSVHISKSSRSDGRRRKKDQTMAMMDDYTSFNWSSPEEARRMATQ